MRWLNPTHLPLDNSYMKVNNNKSISLFILLYYIIFAFNFINSTFNIIGYDGYNSLIGLPKEQVNDDSIDMFEIGKLLY